VIAFQIDKKYNGKQKLTPYFKFMYGDVVSLEKGLLPIATCCALAGFLQFMYASVRSVVNRSLWVTIPE